MPPSVANFVASISPGELSDDALADIRRALHDLKLIFIRDQPLTTRLVGIPGDESRQLLGYGARQADYPEFQRRS